MAYFGINTSAFSLWTTSLIILAQLITGVLVLLLVLKPKMMYILFKTLPRDIRGIIRAMKFVSVMFIMSLQGHNLGNVFDKTAKKYLNKVCFYFEDQTWTFKQVQELTNKVANYFTEEGFKKGDKVALFMENRVEYVGIWIGLAKIGVVPALINTNLKGYPLQHSVQAVECNAIIFSNTLTSSLETILDNEYVCKLPLYSIGSKGNSQSLQNSKDLDSGLENASIVRPRPSAPVLLTDDLCYIYTSGTTGLPKAAIINQSRYVMITLVSHFLQALKVEDVIYTTMPLYHTAAGIAAAGHAVTFGNTIVLRKKFSASNYWKDCIKYNVTVAQYIGELCRYLLGLPEGPEDKGHKVRLMIGNGLRPEIWTQFKDRFGIKTIAEFYGSTEGNCNVVNMDGKIGAVGYIPVWLYPNFYIKVIKVDRDGEPVRDPETGLVTFCQANEPGELIACITPGHPFRDFKGYADANSKQKKILNNIYTKGDSAFRSGDILVMDDYGYLYFKDRTGDTFRWKGENVSTAEVESVISRICGLNDAAVYGVQIPGEDGRAGMAAIVDPNEKLDLEHLANEVAKQLPTYARPLFVRGVKQIDMTGTYKMKKTELQAEGFDISKITDPIYLLCHGKYVRFDETYYRDLLAGKLRI